MSNKTEGINTMRVQGRNMETLLQIEDERYVISIIDRVFDVIAVKYDKKMQIEVQRYIISDMYGHLPRFF